MKSFLKTFSSVKLAIFLLILITIASILGTLIPQQRTAAEYAARYGQISKLLVQLQITNLYHSFWYICLLFLFSLNITVCTLTRLSPKLKKTFKPKLEKETRKLLALKIHERYKKNWDLTRTRDEVKKSLTGYRYRIKEDIEDERAFLLARKKALGPYGSDIVHLGLLVILIGGIISGAWGLRRQMNISEGQVLPVPNADFSLRLDKFETDFYPNGSVKDWRSTLTVIEGDKDLTSKTIEVNHPLAHKGFVFYQSSYGWDWQNPTLEIWVKKTSDSNFLEKMSLKMGEKHRLEEGDTEIALLNFIPDFIIGEKGEIATRSLEPNNPAAYIEGWQEEERVFSGWIFAKFPDFARMHSDKPSDFSFEFKDFQAGQYSGIQVSKDPGANFIWAGSVFLMLGLLLAFFWPTREIRFILEESQQKTDIIAAGIAQKNKETLESEFASVMTSLRRTK